MSVSRAHGARLCPMLAHVVGCVELSGFRRPIGLQAIDAAPCACIMLGRCPDMERKTVLSRMSPPEGRLGSACFAASLLCFPERVLAASQARYLPKRETGLLESEGACTFSRLSRRHPTGPLHCAEHQRLWARPSITRDPELMFCLTAQQVSRRIVKKMLGGMQVSLEPAPQTDVSVASL